jgi:hypothetical protein
MVRRACQRQAGTWLAIPEGMKLFSIKKTLGMAALYALFNYVRKQGGFKNALDSLLAKKNEYATAPAARAPR